MHALITTFLILASLSALSQHGHIAEEYTDEFTGNFVRRTSWESILNPWKHSTCYVRMVKINRDYYFEMKLIDNDDVFAIREGDPIMFKLSNDSIVKIPNDDHDITCLGCGSIGVWGSKAMGVHIMTPISIDQIKQLQAYFAIKIRIYTDEGYLEQELKEESQHEIRTAAFLVERGAKNKKVQKKKRE